ncbi:MAG: TRAM domain-containing protein [candidate division Zixibacteria bacterium]|nr:TRAM domain-containing protein [candidate division Zixibacteria bacterium]
MEIQRDISMHRNQAYVGRTVQVLVDEVDADGEAVGRTEADAPEVDNEVLLSGNDLVPGTFVEAAITDALEYDLVGSVVRVSRPALLQIGG